MDIYSLTLTVLASSSLISIGDCQLAAIFSEVNKTSDCQYWSSWGPCIWTKPLQNRARSRTSRVRTEDNLYLDQLDSRCQKHWFFDFVKKNYGIALNNVFSYLQGITKDDTPCGMCSYRQSCGYGGSKSCHISPAKASRTVLPVYVAEQVCTRRELGGSFLRERVGTERTFNSYIYPCTPDTPNYMPITTFRETLVVPGLRQNRACTSDYATLLRNGNECQLWPSDIPVLTGVDEKLKKTLYKIQWGHCKKQTDRYGKKVCRCCCYPFRPNPRTWNCEPIPGAPRAPGL